MKKIIDKLLMYFPIVASGIILFFNIKCSVISSSLPGLNKVLESIINFTSIIIGILLALFGVVVTLANTDVMKELKQKGNDKTIFKYSIETMLTNFMVLVMSIVFQSLEEFVPKLVWLDIYFYFWFFFVIYALMSSIRTIYYLLLISLNQNDKTKRPESKMKISDEDRLKGRVNSSKSNVVTELIDVEVEVEE